MQFISTFTIAPYSRIGPGFHGCRKPDIVAYAGTKVKGGGTPIDEYSILIGADNQWALDAGTSFSAPVVSGDLAEILTSVPNGNILLAETLLYHGAEKCAIPDPGENLIRGTIFFMGIFTAEEFPLR